MTDPAVLRALVLALLALSLGATARVAWLYSRVTRRLRQTGRASRSGITPLHVVLASLGVLSLQTGLAWALMGGLRNAITLGGVGRLVLYGLGSGLLIAALWVIARSQARRVQFHRRDTHIQIEDVDRVEVSDQDSP